MPVQFMYGCSKHCLILIPFRLAQISCFTLSLKCFSSDSDNYPTVRIRPLLQFPHPPRASPVLLTLLFFPLVPLSYQVLRGSIFSFPLVRYSCPLSAGVWRCLPDVSVERDVLHIHPLLPMLSVQVFIECLNMYDITQMIGVICRNKAQSPVYISSLLIP